jgi:hypothetical protein
MLMEREQFLEQLLVLGLMGLMGLLVMELLYSGWLEVAMS